MGENTNLSDSILSSIKKLVGISEEDESFDLDIIFNVNAAAARLYQLGVLSNPFTISSKEDTYSDLLPGGAEDIINQVKMYFVYKTRLGFDTSGMTSSVITVIQDMIRESEWYLMTSMNPPNTYS